MTKEPLTIIVDDREARASRVADLLDENPEAQVIRKRLRTGDYLVEGRILVERKRIPDFLGSLCDGRLFRQAAALANGGLRGLVIIEGHNKEWHQRDVRRAAIQGALLTLGIVFDLQILRSGDEAETARLLLFAAGQAGQTRKRFLRRPGWRPKDKRARQIYFLTGLPGIGTARAQALLDRFGSIEEVVTASEQDLSTVPNIGAKTAAAIRWAVKETAIPYQVGNQP